jgi:hypothetical protein
MRVIQMRIRRKKLRRVVQAKQRTPLGRARFVLNALNCDPAKQINVTEICVRIVALAQALRERRFYPYQIEPAHRICESLLLHDGDTLSVLMSRQAGKTEMFGAIVAALAIIFPFLAKHFPDDWHLNITDDQGVYRGFRYGIRIGIYAPRLDQSQIMFERVRQTLETDTAKRVLKDLRLTVNENNGNTIKLANGSCILCESASEQSKIEGETWNLLIEEEAQDISDLKASKSLSPMVAATGGSIVKVGTASSQKCHFYTTIKNNERMFLTTGKRNHFFYPYTVALQCNSLYRRKVEQEKLQLGEDSDEFRMSYRCEWIFERGMFVTQEQLFHNKIAQAEGIWATRYPKGIAHIPGFKHYAVVAGIDWGASYDSTFLTLMAVDWTNPLDEGEGYTVNGSFHYTFYQKHILDWLEYVGDNYENQFWNVVEYLRGVKGLKKIVTDSNTCGKPIYDRLVATFEPLGIEVEEFNFQAKLKSDGYKSLYGDLCGHRITFPAGQGFRDNRYQKFVYQMLDLRKGYRNGLMQVAHPEEKGAHDDACFPAGSLVLTSIGEIPIERVKIGTWVATRFGWKKVLAAGQTGVRRLTRIGNIIATPNHPVFCVNKNMYVPLGSLTITDTVLECRRNDLKLLVSKPSLLTEFDFTETCSQRDASTGSVFGRILNGSSLRNLSISMFGKKLTEKFQKVTSFITRTKTERITNCRIWSFLRSAITLACTPQGQNRLRGQRRQLNLLKKLRWRRDGTRQLTRETLLVGGQSSNGQRQSTVITSAENAGTYLDRAVQLGESFVPIAVGSVNGDESVKRRYESDTKALVPVYNLMVAEVNEFVCQGVVVHNCDSVMMAAWGANSKSSLGDIELNDKNPFYR